MFIWHWLLTVTGVNSTSSYWNAFWGGFGSDLTEFAVLAVVWRKVNCHAKGCFRIGLHHVPGTPYITCRTHHPVHPGNKAATAENIAQAHADGVAKAEAQANQAGVAAAETPAAGNVVASTDTE